MNNNLTKLLEKKQTKEFMQNTKNRTISVKGLKYEFQDWRHQTDAGKWAKKKNQGTY